MQRLSSNLTLFLKLTLPVGWISFFGLFALVIFLVDTTDKPLIASPQFRIGFLSFFLIFVVLIYFTIFQLKRVEQENGFIFVTNYFKTIKFPIDNISTVSTMDLGIFKVVWFHLKSKGVFGKRIPFIAQKTSFQSFEAQNPILFPAKNNN
jgi:hypothetical protein